MTGGEVGYHILQITNWLVEICWATTFTITLVCQVPAFLAEIIVLHLIVLSYCDIANNISKRINKINSKAVHGKIINWFCFYFQSRDRSAG